STWHEIVAGISGRLAYLGAASLGLTVIGLAVALRLAVPGESVDPAPRARRAFARSLLFVVAVTVVSNAFAVVTSGHAGVNYLYYGRYSETVAAPAFVLGLMWCLRTSRRRTVANAALLATAFVVVAALAAHLLERHPGDPSITWANVVGLFPASW